MSLRSMTLSKFAVASLLGVMSLSSGALATRDLNQATSRKDICKTNPSLPRCKLTSTAPPPLEPEVADSDVELSAEGPADAEVGTILTSPSPPTRGSSAKCYAYAAAGGDTGGQTEAEAAVEVAAYMCGGTGFATAEAAASATATLFAQAVAQASVLCVATGDTKFYAQANAKAVQTAEAWLTAYAEAFATATVCGKCDAFASSWGYVEKYVFLEAVASASAILEGYTTAGSLKDFIGYASDYQNTVKTAVATAYASAIADAAIYYDGASCFAWVNTNGCIYTPDHPDPEFCEGFSCEAVAASESFITEIDAISTASANAATYTCGDQAVAEAETYVVATSLAEAVAIAVSEVYVSCKADDGAIACADASTYITDSAYAVAKAFAEAWAGAYNCEDTCVVDVDAATEAVGSILATACSSAYESVCAVDGEHWTANDLQIDIEAKYLEAIAEAYAYSFSSNDPLVCVAAVETGSSVTPVFP